MEDENKKDELDELEDREPITPSPGQKSIFDEDEDLIESEEDVDEVDADLEDDEQ